MMTSPSAASPNGASLAHDLFAVLHDGNGLLELRAVPSKARVFVPPHDAAAIAQFMDTHRDEHVFYGVGLRKDASSGTLDNVAALSAVWVDIDDISETEAFRRIEEFPLCPTAVVASGGGYHVFWRLREPLTDLNEGGRLLRRLATLFDADPKAAECARCLRVPGTINPKYDPPRRAVIRALDPQAIYNPSEFEDWLPSRPATPPTTLRVGSAIPKGQRNDTLFRLGRSVAVKGVTERAVAALLKEANAAQCDPPLPDDEVSAIVRSVMQSPDRPDFERQPPVAGMSIQPGKSQTVMLGSAVGHGMCAWVDCGEPRFEVVSPGRAYRIGWPRLDLVFEVGDLRWSGVELVGDLAVRLNRNGIIAVDGCLSRANLRVTDATARATRAKLLQDRSCDPTIPFDLLLEACCQAVVADVRQPDAAARTGLSTVEEAFACLQASLTDEGQHFGLGVPILDRAMGGIGRGELLTILARTDSWKTMFLITVLGTWCAQAPDCAWVFATLEMRRDQVLARLLRQHFGLTATDLEAGIRSGSLNLREFFDRYQHVRFIDDGAVSLDRIASEAQTLRRESPVPLGGIFVDHAGLVRARGGSAYERATDTAVGLKQLARQADVAVVAVVQANRGAANSTDPVALESARDSGAYEENADFCLAFGQQVHPPDGSTPFVRAELKKNRRGPRVGLVFEFDRYTLRMTEAAGSRAT